MNKKFTKLIAALALLAFMMPSLAGWGQTRTEEVYKQTIFNTTNNSGNINSYENSWYNTTDGFRNNITNANNANNSWSYIKMGSKSKALTGTIITNAAIDKAIAKVSLTIDAITASDITSIKLYGSNNGSSWNEIGSFLKETGTKDVTIDEPTSNLYYKIEVVCKKASSNGPISISKIEYYHDAAPAGPSVTLESYEINAPAAGINDGTLNVTYNNITTPLSEVLICDAEGNETTCTWFTASINNEDNVYYVVDANIGVARIAYFKVWSYDDDENVVYSDPVTVTQAAASYTLAITENEDIELSLFDGEGNSIEIDDETGNATIETGTEVSVSFGVIDGVDCRVFDALTVTDANNQPLQLTEITPNVYYSFTMPTSNATLTITTTDTPNHTLILGDLSHVTLAMTSGFIGDDVTFTNNEATLCEGINVTVIVTVEEGYVMGSVSVVDENNQSVVVTSQGTTSDGEPVYSFTMPAANATITATATLPPTYSLVTSIGDLVSGKHYIIANGTSGTTVKAMGKQNSNNREAEPVTFNNDNKIEYDEDVYEFVINGPEMITKNDQQVAVYTIYDVRNSGYLYAAGNGDKKNYLRNQSFNDDNGRWSISINNDNSSDDYGKATIVAQGDNANKYMRYNGNNTSIFSCYAEGSSVTALPYLYMKDDDTNYEFYKDIAKYTTPEEGQPTNGWYLIASPVASVTPSAQNGLLTNTYDLYRFDQTGGGSEGNGKEWRNYKQNNFNLVGGQGYLYANSENVTLRFTGTPNTTPEVGLVYSEGAELAGWNLIGNPLGQAASVDYSYYRMNDAHNEIIAGNGVVAAMEGILVKATEDGQNVTFVPATQNANANSDAMVVMNLSQNRGNTIDRAIVRFNESRQLPKFMLNTENTKVYIPQNGEDFAIVSSNGQGEMPVNFKARENGTYTLTVNPENVEMGYLHLIDNMTGDDIDLLQTPSYTFNATTRDYESRFRLVFSANGENGASTGSTTFAFISDGNLVVSNEGEATLQVVDLTGRILSSNRINGSCSTEFNAPAGVYMIRLINGNDVKVQKIVVR